MITFEPHFTGGEDPYEDLTWTKRLAQIGDPDDPVFEQEDVEFPDTWSQRAVNIVASKYFHGSGDDREDSLKQIINRVVNAIYQSGWRLDYYGVDQETAKNFSYELRHILVNQIASFNSPVWFNIGVEGVRQQAAACFINRVEDDMESILALGVAEGQIFKRGSGAGVNISRLRGEGEPLSGGGISSGPISFMRGFDAQAGTIRSGGVTRRAAKMVIMDDDHPDLMEFIACKKKEERKAKALIAAGYDGAIDGEAYGSVFFQNGNHSVRLSNDFMQQCQDDMGMEGIGPWYATRRTDGGQVEMGSAEHILEEIAATAWECGDPGIQFSSTINDWHTCSETDEIRGSNPCSEFVFLDNTSCNLASINVLKFWDADEKVFDWDGLKHTVRLLITAQEILVSIGDYPTDDIKEQTRNTRPLGLGLTNLGALLMTMGLPYDSDEGRDWASAVMAVITGTAYSQSAVMASERGSFSEYSENKEAMKRVLHQHKNAAFGLAHGINLRRPGHGGSIWNILDTDGDFWETAANYVEEAWDEAVKGSQLCGYRNAQVTVIAPTGTISFMMDCDTTGVEPLLAPTYHKTLVGGGTMEINPNCYADGRREILLYDREELHFKQPRSKEELAKEPLLATALGDNTLTPMAHLKMVAALQPFVSGAISKTINMPSETTVEEVRDIFLAAWKYGIKCVTIYRDGSKDSQPLNVEKPKRTITDISAILEHPAIQKQIEEDMIAATQPGPIAQLLKGGCVKPAGSVRFPVRRKLDHTRPAITHKFDIAGHEGYLTIGLYKTGEVAEIFVSMAKEGTTISGLLGQWAMTTSIALQYGVPLDLLIEKHSYVRYEPSGFTGDETIKQAHSITDYIMRWIAANLESFKEGKDLGKVSESVSSPKSGTITTQFDGNMCSVCGGILQQQGTCHVCNTCGTANGCG